MSITDIDLITMKLSKDDQFKKSILIAAHPDDEILWFSSILEHVDKVLFCYSDCDKMPHWGVSRKKVISLHPVRNVSSLSMKESSVFDYADWENPELSKLGIKIFCNNVSSQIYQENYYNLIDILRNKLINYDNVFTHNPWGEYGNEEHIQLYTIVKQLQEEIKFTIWFSNYCSNKSMTLMNRCLSELNFDYFQMKTNKQLASQVKRLYQDNECWTWYDDWEWVDDEAFLKDLFLDDREKMYGHIFPLNMVKVWIKSKERKRIGLSPFTLFQRAIKKLKDSSLFCKR